MADSMCAVIAQTGSGTKNESDGLHRADINFTTSNIENPDEIQLVETFYVISKNNVAYSVKLTKNGLIITKEQNTSSRVQKIQLRDIIGCQCSRRPQARRNASSCKCAAVESIVDSDVSIYLHIYAYVQQRNGHRERTTISLRFCTFNNYEQNNEAAQKWQLAIKYLIRRDSKDETPMRSNGLTTDNSTLLERSSPQDTRKVLVLLNPKSGQGKAREMFQKYAAQVFDEAEIPFDLRITKCANFGREFVRRCNIYNWRSIVVVGGDGIYYEVLNGIFERPDWERITRTIPIGIIPCGSGNGLAKTIAHVHNEPYDPNPVLNAALSVFGGHSAPMDVVRVETKSEILFSFLSVGWGFISDIDMESERLRSIGKQRFVIWSLHRLINLRTYSGTLSYLPVKDLNLAHHRKKITASGGKLGANVPEHSMSYSGNISECCSNDFKGVCGTCDATFCDVLETNSVSDTVNSSGNFPNRLRLESWQSAQSIKSSYFSNTESIYHSVDDQQSEYGSVRDLHPMYGPASNLPALTEPVPADWRVEKGEFIMVHAVYQTHIASDCHFAPLSQLNDGVIWMVVIRAGASRRDILKFLLGTYSGTHIPTKPNQYIEMIPVTAFRIEPSGTQGRMNVDGELIEYGPVQAEIFPGITRVLVPKPHHDSVENC